MAELGFWSIAQDDPESSRWSTPTSARCERASCSPRQPGRARPARARASSRATRSRWSCPNGVELFELYLAALQAGFYLVPVNHHLVGPEIAYIVSRLRGQGLRGPRAVRRDVPRPRPTRPASPRTSASPSATVAGFRPVRRTHRRPARRPRPTTAPRGAVMNYTSGTTGTPEGRAPAAARRRRPRRAHASGDAASASVRHRSRTTTTSTSSCSPLYHTAVLDVRGRRAAHRPHASCSWTSGRPRRCCGSSSSYGVTHSHMVPTQFHRLLALPDDVKGAVRRVVAAPHDPRRRALPARGQARR